MKKSWVILIGLLLLLAQLYASVTIAEAETGKTFPKRDLVEITIVEGDSLVNICKYYLDSEHPSIAGKRWPGSTA
jgi:hypothetical protein